MDIRMPKAGKLSMGLVRKAVRMKDTVVVLWIIGRGSAHGYAIMKDLNEMGMGYIKASRIYPLLSSMAKEKLVTRGRKGRKVCYAITAKGAKCLSAAKGFMSHGMRGQFMREMAGCNQK
jgi:DNA-binding PadR family transcriptional regulator